SPRRGSTQRFAASALFPIAGDCPSSVRVPVGLGVPTAAAGSRQVPDSVPLDPCWSSIPLLDRLKIRWPQGRGSSSLLPGTSLCSATHRKFRADTQRAQRKPMVWSDADGGKLAATAKTPAPMPLLKKPPRSNAPGSDATPPPPGPPKQLKSLPGMFAEVVQSVQVDASSTQSATHS